MADEEVTPRSGELTTANYGWTKPNVGDSDDAWGGMLNADLDGIDSVVHGIQTSIPAPYVLPTATTTVLGGVKVDGSTITIAGGVISGAPSGPKMTISDTAPSSPKAGDLWYDSVGGQTYLWYTDPNTSQWVVVVNQNAPDLSQYLPLTGGTLTGPLSLAADPTTSLGAATKQYSDTKLAKAGVTDGSDAPAGQIGEVISASNTAGSAMTTGAVLSIASIVLMAGDWDVSGEVWISIGTGGTAMVAAISTSPSTFPSGPAIGTSRSAINAAFGASSTNILAIRTCRVSISVGATYYLIGQANFSSGTSTAFGNIWARRAR